MKKKTLAYVFLITFSLSLNLASASPDLTIHSPTNSTTYDTDGVLFNVTSSEPVDFYILSKSGRKHYIAHDTTSYQSILYQKAGDYTFTIHANSSSGDSNSTIYYSSSVTNPIEIDDCGFIESSNTKYVLVNNISGPYCMIMEEVSNVSMELNGFSIHSMYEAFIASLAEQVLVENGTISSDLSTIYMEGVNNFIFRDLDILTGYAGVYGDGCVNVLFDNDVFRIIGTEEPALILEFYEGSNVHIKDTTIDKIDSIFHSSELEYTIPVFYDTFENVTFLLPEGNDEFNIVCEESSQCNLAFIDSDYSNASFDAYGYAANIVITEYSRLDVSTIDQEGQGVPSTLEIDSLSPFEHNPTIHVLSATESDGNGKVHLSNKLSVYKSGTNNLVLEQDYPSYNVTAYSGTLSDSSEITFASAAQINFTFVFPVAAPYIIVDNCDTLSSGNEYRLNQNITADQDPCITAEGVSDITFNLDGYSIDGYGYNAIFINNSVSIDVLNGYIKNSSDSISSKDSSDLTLQDLEITDSSRGIQLEQVSDSIIQDNSVGNNNIGINMVSSQDVTLIENTFFNNTENVVIDPSHDIIFIKNIIQAAEIGLKLIDIINSVFIGDMFTGNNESIILNNSANIDFIRSTVNSTTSDLKSINSNLTFSNVAFNVNKIEEIGESSLYGFFPPACIYGEDYVQDSICNGTLILDLDINLKVLSGDTCTIKQGATLTGDINVEGGILDIKGSTIIGDIINGTGALISVKGPGTTIDGNILIEESSELFIKDINITGNISSQGSDTVFVKDNVIGGSVLSTNDDTVIIKDNSIQGDINIINPSSCDEKQNDVGGSNSGCP